MFSRKYLYVKAVVALSLLTACLPNSYPPLSYPPLSVEEKNKAQSNIKYKIPNLNLDTFSEEKKDILFDYLSKSSEWHVFPVEGMTIAAKREKSKTCNPVQKHFPRSDFTGLIGYAGNNPLSSSSDISGIIHHYPIGETRANDNERVGLSLYNYIGKSDAPPGYEPSLGSKLIIESKNKKLILNANEISKNTSRKSTTNFLYDIKGKLEKLAAYSLAKKNYESLLPPGSILVSERSIISIQKNEDGFTGDYKISGYVNAMEKGLIKIKVINLNDNTNMRNPGFEKDGTHVEYVGWSTNPMQKFNFCLVVNLESRDESLIQTNAEFQVWFKPANSNQERMLLSQSKIVDLWLNLK
jgi:hypothetical protein